jgi:exopolyphosphatase / guanosine-5'-triphosphate,3'-diphosphate pyrophosphatase
MDRPLATSQRELRAADLEAVREQLGREPTTPFTVVARCPGTKGRRGHPLVIRNAPLDAAGNPFPTTFWLTCRRAVKAVSRLESEGWIGRLADGADETFVHALEAAHRAYADERAEELPAARDWGGVGGTRSGIKCLHAHYAYRLAGGDDPVGAWVAERIEPVHAEQLPGRVAAIDQGTNSCRLLVIAPIPGEDPAEVARDMVITRLGAGVDRSGRLDRAAIDRTLTVLGRYVRRSRALGAERIRVAATSAVRDAGNREDFLGPVRALVGREPEVIDGEQEAALSYLGGTQGLDPSLGPFLVVDIGGGSTELVVGSRPGTSVRAVSTQMGSVRLTERFIHSDPPSTEDLRALEAAIDGELVKAGAAVSAAEARTFVSVAGTATTMQAVSLNLSRYDPDLIHRTWLSRADAEATLRRLAAMTNEERASLPVMVPGRGDVIVAGAMILTGVLRRFGFDRTLVSETDILDGLAFELLDG